MNIDPNDFPALNCERNTRAVFFSLRIVTTFLLQFRQQNCQIVRTYGENLWLICLWLWGEVNERALLHIGVCAHWRLRISCPFSAATHHCLKNTTQIHLVNNTFLNVLISVFLVLPATTASSFFLCCMVGGEAFELLHSESDILLRVFSQIVVWKLCESWDT